MKKINSNELKTLLNDATKKIDFARDKIEINTIVENMLTSLFDSEFASLWMFDPQKVVLQRERNDGTVREVSMLNQRGVLAKCFLTLSGGIFNYLASEKEYREEVDNPDDIRIKSEIILPLTSEHGIVGIVTVYSSVENIRKFDESDMELLHAVAPFLTKILEHMYFSERLKKESENVIERVEEIEQQETTEESSDETLNFLANTVHDIRTPANTLYGFLELLEEQLDDPRLLQYIDNAKESAAFINELITSIMERVSSQREQTLSKPVAIHPTRFFSDIASIFSANMYNKGLTFNVYIDPQIASEIIVEDIKLKRVIMNLIGNAYKFTPVGKNIDFLVSYNTLDNTIAITVRDTGIGIAKEQQSEIFKAFRQAEDDTALKYGGTGLGLAICAEYVKDLGGKLQLESELDTGSTFHFEIPVKVSDTKEVFSPLNPEGIHIGVIFSKKKNASSVKNLVRNLNHLGIPSKKIVRVKDTSTLPKNMTHLICFQNKLNDTVIQNAKEANIALMTVEESFMSLTQHRMDESMSVVSQYTYYANTLHTFVSKKRALKVLIVDDDRITIQLMKAILDDSVCRIKTAMDGESALEMLKEGIEHNDPYAVVYLDRQMPKMSGIEVVEALRALEEKKRIEPAYTVYISGDPNTTKQEKKLFDSFIGKPFKRDEISASLKEAMK